MSRAVSLLLLLVCGAAAVPAAASASSASGTLGVYRGSGGAERVAEWERWTGRPAYRVLDFLDRASWDKIENPTWWVNSWRDSAYRERVVYSVPMLPDSPGSASLAIGATGAYDEHFARLARLLISRGQAGAAIRLGWEFNGDWYRWNAALDPDAFVTYWRRIVRAMRAQPGAAFKFDWCPNDGKGTIAPDRVYPGDAYVDYVGADVYDHGWSPGYQDPTQRWREIRDQPYGLAWQRQFAGEHGKPTSFPEWAVVRSAHGGGDSPEFIRRMYDWIESGNVAYSIYFEVDTGAPMRLMTGNFPNATSAFQTLFGAPAPVPKDAAPAPSPSLPAAQPPAATPKRPAKKKTKRKARHACARQAKRVRNARGKAARKRAQRTLKRCRAAAKRKQARAKIPKRR